MDCSIFTDKNKKPGLEDLKTALGRSYHLWQEIHHFVVQKYPSAVCEWNYPGSKYGWSYRIKDKKRAIIYLLPRDKRFMVAFVFGQKAFEKIMTSKISSEIKLNLQAAKIYAEGRGIRIEVKNQKILRDIQLLTEIKLES